MTTETEEGPFAIIAVGEFEGEKLESVSAFVSRYEDGPPAGEKDRPRTFNTEAQAEKWIRANISEENIEAMDWIIIPTVKAVELDDSLELDPETKKFV